MRMSTIFAIIAAILFAALFIEPETVQAWVLLLAIGGLAVALVGFVPWPLPLMQMPAGRSVSSYREGGIRRGRADTTPGQKTSVSGYKDIIDQLEIVPDIKKFIFIGVLPGLFLSGILYFLSPDFFMSPGYGWASVAGGAILYKRRKLVCPNCNDSIRATMKWECPCSAENDAPISWSCRTCKRKHHAILCPSCFEPMLLTKVSLGWDKGFVDSRTARPIINGKPVSQPAPPAPPPPPPRPKPPPKPQVDPVIQMMNEYLTSSMQYRDFLAKTEKDLRARYRDDPSFVDETMEDLENKIREHREAQSRGAR
jgi:hypothetical protein